ncbi:chloride channel protein [Halomonas sp. 22501_18_FS]|uniref:Chloride channel protein n=2 Tax=Pseudomonadota TaxID=1224 RepID=A0A9X5B575_9GAMM|nr:chloride channel protein [Halospina sp. K52047b]MYL27311.1 chloride channel protein [Halomonas utahensis]MYL75990.1 chloride channel protein [Halomonas sp. 22501_18_FS]
MVSMSQTTNNQTEGSATAPVEGASPNQPLNASIMLILAVGVGIFGGFSAIAFKAIIGFFRNLFFYGELSLAFQPDIHIAPSVWGAGVILVPVVGAIIVNWITERFAPETRGHGVPEVMNAIYFSQGRIRPSVVIAKALTSAVSIGSGGSVGREGPIVQIGSAFGSSLGQLITMPARQRVVLVGAGAAAAVAATFNAPIGGLAFAMELMLVSISARTVTVVAIATVTATYIGRFYSGLHPSFDVPELVVFENHLVGFYSLLACIPLGALIGVISSGFIRSIYSFEDWFERRFTNSYVRHVSGMAVVGVMLYGFIVYTGQYHIGGVGYPTILDVLRSILSDPLFLALLFLGKWLATALTLGSGASGGVFAPSLFLGAIFGALFGNLVLMVFPASGVDPVVLAIAGMGGMIAGTTGAVLTAVIMVFELTGDYAAMLPIIATVSFAYAVRSAITEESIYTLKLVRRGYSVPHGLQAATSHLHSAGTLMNTEFDLIDVQLLRQWEATHTPERAPRYAIAVDDDTIDGVVHENLHLLSAPENTDWTIDRNFLRVTSETSWSKLMRSMHASNCEVVLVMHDENSQRATDVLGVITPREISLASKEDAYLMH